MIDLSFLGLNWDGATVVRKNSGHDTWGTLHLDEEDVHNLINGDLGSILCKAGRQSHACIVLSMRDVYCQTLSSPRLVRECLARPPFRSARHQNSPHRERYGTNQDIFVHVRLSDAAEWNPGVEYYVTVLDNILIHEHVSSIHIASDDLDHITCQTLKEKYNAKHFQGDGYDTLLFGSTCRYLILSNGSYSNVMACLADDTTSIFYPDVESLVSIAKKKQWHPIDLFDDTWPNWRKVVATRTEGQNYKFQISMKRNE